MNRHQVLTGAANNHDFSVSIGSVENNNFIAYTSGCNVVILSSNFERVQIISGNKHNNSIVRCIDCTFDTGKIAASYDNYVAIYEPTPSAKKESHNLFYKWIHIGTINLDSTVIALSWNMETNRLLIGSSLIIQMWCYTLVHNNNSSSGGGGGCKVKFSLNENDNNKVVDELEWKKIWETKVSSSLKYLQFSPDGSLFASYGENDRLVKIWYEVRSPTSIITNEDSADNPQYHYIYLAHPRAVTSLQWRKISKFMPRGMIANTLITSCKDNICRIWAETILPDDGLINTNQEENSSSYTKISKTSRHKRTVLHKLHKMRLNSHLTIFSKTSNHSFSNKNLSSNSINNIVENNNNNLSPSNNNHHHHSSKLQNSLSCQEFCAKHNLHHSNSNSTMNLGFHFHLAGFINAENGILNLNMSQQMKGVNFVVNWMNNKDFTFTLEAELISRELIDKLKKIQIENEIKNKENGRTGSSSSNEESSSNEDINNNGNEIGKKLNQNETIDYNYAAINEETKALLLSNSMDLKLDSMMKEWYNSHDMLFCIHPVDGSILIWVVDWLDEYMPNGYRQAQISFHARLPNAVPIGDAISMKPHLCLFSASLLANQRPSNKLLLNESSFNPQGIINMVSSHNNGTLNLWQMTFQESTKYQSLINILQLSRICGHRFRVNDITCHPTLPLLLSNSNNEYMTLLDDGSLNKTIKLDSSETFQTGLIIWRVEPVGPLSKSGGIYELARIDSSTSNAFENIAWFPCFLPSSTLGNISSSPSTLFASTDSECITVYQAVLDARTLLHEMQQTHHVNNSTLNNTSKLVNNINTTDIPYNSFNVVSIQSTARPGCIIELDKIVDSKHDWKKSHLFHVFQEDLIDYNKSRNLHAHATGTTTTTTIDDVNSLANSFNENFFLVLLEKQTSSSSKPKIHMWRLTISSSPLNFDDTTTAAASDNSKKFVDSETTVKEQEELNKNRITITSSKVNSQELNLPDSVQIICADPAAADLASSCMFTLSKVPYLFATGCSDGVVRFWSCDRTSENEYKFYEWNATNCDPSPSATTINGYPLAIACAYNGRFAVAYKIKNLNKNSDDPFMNICVHIYECESSGGSNWNLEDSIHLQNIKLPELDSGINFDYIYGNEKPIHPSRSSHSFKHILFNTNDSTSPEIPSTVTKYSIRQQQHISAQSPSIPSYLTRLVQLDWASMENGSHILTVGLGNKIFVYSCVSRNLEEIKLNSNSASGIDLTRRKQSRRFSIHDNNKQQPQQQADLHNSLLKWIQFRSLELDSADGMQALPVQMKWVRDGLLIVGLDTEMQVYSQWTSTKLDGEIKQNYYFKAADAEKNSSKILPSNPSVLDFNLLAKSNLFKANDGGGGGGGGNKNETIHTASSSTHLVIDDDVTLNCILNSGLFIQAKREWPVLPQYHPTQLFELMNAGKINRVKAILMHLIRCIIDCEFEAKIKNTEKRRRRRTLSANSNEVAEEEQNLSFLEIKSIPPLPMFALYAADFDLFTPADSLTIDSNKKEEDYNDLFERKNSADSDDPFKNGDNEEEEKEKEDKKMNSDELEFKKKLLLNDSTTNFNANVCNILIDYLMYVRLAGLDSLDQMYLVALVDTVANVKCDVTFNKNEDLFLKKEYNFSNRRGSIPNEPTSQIIDNCGLKYLLSLRHYNYLMKTLPIANRTKLMEIGIGTSNYAWAYHSECEQELLNSLPRVSTGKDIKWSELRQYGVGWWLKSSNSLRVLIEKLAKCAFQQKNDPLDAALYYLAMKKKGVVWGLFKTIKDLKMTDFFKNDFTEQRWQSAALKNAYALLGKQRFEHAAAFFLLAGKLKDAVEICLHNLHDIQLAFVIIRLYETDVDQANAFIKQILNIDVLGFDSLKNEYNVKNSSKDPFLRSIAHWYSKEYNLALSTLYDADFINKKENDESFNNSKYDVNAASTISDVFNFYTFLKNHPLVMLEKTIKINKNDFNLTSIERRLFFQTAYYHIINGCPLLTLDVLSKLPKYLELAEKTSEEPPIIEIKNFDEKDYSTPVKIEKAQDFDWSNPISTSRFVADELDLAFSDDDEEDEELSIKSDDKNETIVEEVGLKAAATNPVESSISEDKVVDLFAQQLKFIACLKVLIEEMSTLATGFEVTGGQLRYYMYYWLERETSILKDLSDYQCSICEKNLNMNEIDDISHNCMDVRGLLTNRFEDEENHDDEVHLHEQVIKDQKSFHEKIQRLNRRKLWLRSNELLLRTLLSYCSLHSAHGGGLASVRMELILLMQELIEDRGMKQLLSPLPLPTTIPLLTAIVVSSKTVVAGPIRLINGLINDILLSINDLSVIVPTIFDNSITISTIKELSVSLSACIYQCLCDSDAFSVPKNSVRCGMQGFCRTLKNKNTFLMSGLRQSVTSIPDVPKIDSSPKHWPGVSNLIKLLDREQDVEAPKLKILLFESLIAVYSALLLNAFVFYDCSTLWRLLAQSWDGEMWGKLFGGGCKTEFKYKTSGIRNLVDESTKHRMKMNARLGHTKASVSSEEKIFIREHFIAPQISMINFFLTKPENVNYSNDSSVDYDTDDDCVERGVEDDLELTHGKRFLEHMNPNSYSWCLMRYAIIKYALVNLTTFLGVIGVELQELPILSPIVNATLKTYESWLNTIRVQMNSFNAPPDDYIPGCAAANSTFNGPKILKYQSMLDPANTPFCNDRSANAAKRLWHFLVTRKSLYDIFIRYIFKKKTITNPSSMNDGVKISGGDVQQTTMLDLNSGSTFKIIHKEQEAIHGFCLNERDKTMLSLSTSKEIIEMDIKNLLVKNITIEDECEIDILTMQNSRSNVDTELLVVGNSNDPYTNLNTNEISSKGASNVKNFLSHPYSAYLIAERTKYLLSKLLKRNVKEVRRFASHPVLPYYLSGTNEGVVKLWHWGSNEPLSTCKQGDKSVSAKISKIQFNTHGNKFGVGDVEGYLHLYQLLGCSFKSYMTLRCHKVLNDFMFVDSSSLLFTVGIFNDSYEVSLWDTLMPPNKALTMCFREPDIPSATCVAYSPINHFAYVGNRKGDIKIYDLRMHKVLQKIVAHESSVKAITIDKDEYYMATGSSEGNIKIWNLKNLNIVQSYHGDHSKSSLIRNFNAGVNQLHFTSDNQLISCGTDGTLLIRNFNNNNNNNSSISTSDTVSV